MQNLRLWCAFTTAWALAGCASDHAVIASTATTIGVEVSSNPTTGAPTGVLGYRRAEFAFVPTNRAKVGEPVNSQTPSDVSKVANVLMELNYSGTISTKGSIYQRLAVGTEAVTGQGAAVMFARDADGGLSPELAAAAVNGAKITLRNADKVLSCTVKDGKSDPAALGKIVARAAQDPATGKFVTPYQPMLAGSQPESDLRQLLAQSDTLAAALARHQSAADCVAP